MHLFSFENFRHLYSLGGRDLVMSVRSVIVLSLMTWYYCISYIVYVLSASHLPFSVFGSGD